MPDSTEHFLICFFRCVICGVWTGERLKGSETELADAVGAVAVEEADSDWACLLELRILCHANPFGRWAWLSYSMWHEQGCWASEVRFGQVKSWRVRVWMSVIENERKRFVSGISILKSEKISYFNKIFFFLYQLLLYYLSKLKWAEIGALVSK